VKLVVEQGNLAGQEFSLEPPVISIGRGADNDVVLLEHGVSRHHARLQQEPQGWVLIDLGSTNGTYVSGQRLPAHQAHLLQPGDQLRIGFSVLALRQVEESDEFWDGETLRPSRRIHPAIMIMGALAIIVVLAGIVLLLVTVLRPEPQPPTPTMVEPMEHMLTALPLPTGFEDMVTAVATMLPEGLPLPLLGGTPTPTP
jgi:hypothetical protein